MAIAIFGISNSGLNLVVNLFILMLVVVWLALIVYTYLDAKRRISDPFLVGCATIGSFIPYIGTAVYAIVRPPEFLEDAHERELEIEAAELRVRQLKEASCPGCGFPIERTYLRCPSCQRRLKDPCASCGKPVDSRWALCPYCEATIAERQRRRPAEERRAERPGRPDERASRREGRATRREERAPRADQRPPRPEQRESRPEQKAPRPEERAPRPDERAARSERRTSRAERGAQPEEPGAEQDQRKKQPTPAPGKGTAADASDEALNPKRPQRSQSRESDPDPRQA